MDRLHELRRYQEQQVAEESEMEFELRPAKKKLDELRGMTAELEEMQAQYLLTNSKRAQQAVDRKVADISAAALAVRQLIRDIQAETHRLRERGASETMCRIRDNQANMLGKKLLEVTKGAWDMQAAYDGSVRDQVTRRLQIRYTNADGTTMPQAEAQAIAVKLVEANQQDQIFAAARNELSRAMRTQEEVERLERSMRELFVMFQDMSILVETQGEGLLLVERQAERAADNVAAGNRQLHLAKKYQRSRCCTAS